MAQAKAAQADRICISLPDRVYVAHAHLHGLAGDGAAERKGQESLLAGDLLEAIPAALRSLAHTAPGEIPSPTT